MDLKRLRRARRGQPPVVLERQPDALPKRGLFSEPVRVTRLEALDPERLDDGRRRVTFLVEIRDADDRRCSDVAVEADVRGPERQRTVQGATDMLGRIRFRMAGPPGGYGIELTDVAAGGLDWARRDGPSTAQVDVEA